MRGDPVVVLFHRPRFFSGAVCVCAVLETVLQSRQPAIPSGEIAIPDVWAPSTFPDVPGDGVRGDWWLWGAQHVSNRAACSQEVSAHLPCLLHEHIEQTCYDIIISRCRHGRTTHNLTGQLAMGTNREELRWVAPKRS